jgi:DNA-binding HxlR family transcriptional regulator
LTFDLVKDVKIKFGNELPNEIIITLKLIGKKWAMPILYALNDKNLGFSGLKRDIGEKISSNMLSRALEELQQAQLIEKRIISMSPIRVEYSATIYGNDLCDLCLALGAFGAKYLVDENGEGTEEL